VNSSWRQREKHTLVSWRRIFQCFNLEPKSSAYFYDGFKSRKISFRFPWVSRCGSLEEQAPANVGSQSILLLTWPTSSSLDSLSLSVVFVGGFGTGNSALWGTGLISDGKLGYWTVCLDFAVTPVILIRQKYQSEIWSVGSLQITGVAKGIQRVPSTNYARSLAHVTQQKWGAQLLSWSPTWRQK
jgi:hypothetical protein